VPYSLLARILAWPGSVTVWLLLTIVLNGVSGWTLARVLGARTGAVVAAAALAFNPYVAHEAMEMNSGAGRVVLDAKL